MIYTFSLEVTVENRTNNKTNVIDLFIGLDDVKEKLLDMVNDEQIKVMIDLDKPNRNDYNCDEDFNEAIEDYEVEFEDAIEDYKSEMEFSDFNEFLRIRQVDGSFNIKFDDFEDIENITSRIEDVSDDDDWRIVLAIYNQTYHDLEQAIDAFNSGDYHWYPDMDMEEVVEEQIDSGIWGDIPSNIRNYLDIEAMARDLSHDGYTYDDEANGVIATY